MLNEFKAFIARGNVMDLAVGVIIGAAFSRIVESIVNDLVMPIVGALTGGGFDFSNYFLPLSRQRHGRTRWPPRVSRAPCSPTATSSPWLINFVILAWIIFLMVKAVNRIRASVEKEKARRRPAPPPADVALLTEIRDLLEAHARSESRPRPRRIAGAAPITITEIDQERQKKLAWIDAVVR